MGGGFPHMGKNLCGVAPVGQTEVEGIWVCHTSIQKIFANWHEHFGSTWKSL